MSDPFYQTLPKDGYPPEAAAFADALEDVMNDGTHDLAGIAAGLTSRGIIANGHTTWTPEILSAYLAKLANA
jgi:hypothetical protein